MRHRLLLGANDCEAASWRKHKMRGRVDECSGCCCGYSMDDGGDGGGDDDAQRSGARSSDLPARPEMQRLQGG